MDIDKLNETCNLLDAETNVKDIVEMLKRQLSYFDFVKLNRLLKHFQFDLLTIQSVTNLAQFKKLLQDQLNQISFDYYFVER